MPFFINFDFSKIVLLFCVSEPQISKKTKGRRIYYVCLKILLVIEHWIRKNNLEYLKYLFQLRKLHYWLTLLVILMEAFHCLSCEISRHKQTKKASTDLHVSSLFANVFPSIYYPHDENRYRLECAKSEENERWLKSFLHSPIYNFWIDKGTWSLTMPCWTLTLSLFAKVDRVFLIFLSSCSYLLFESIN